MSGAKPDIPYAVQMSMALLADNKEKAAKIMQEGLGSMAEELTEFVQGYSVEDMPIVAAAMKTCVNALVATLGETGREAADYIVEHITCIAIDMKELKRQSEGEET